MESSPSSKTATSWYKRFSIWSNTILAGFLLFLSKILQKMAHLFSGNARLESSARLFKNIAALIVQPESRELMDEPRLYAKAVYTIVFLVCPLTFASVFAVLEADARAGRPTQLVLSSSFLLIVLLCVVIFSMLLTMLINLLALSGDFSLGKQDELQKILSNQAAAFTLRFVVVLLVLLFLGDLFMQGWRDLVAVHLGLIFFLARISYLLKLLQLRWKEMVEVEIEDGIRKQA